MPLQRVEINQLDRKKALTHMELSMLLEARKKASEGHDILFMRLFLEEELARWKKTHDRYRNAPTAITARGRELYMTSQGTDLVVFKSRF